MTSNKKQLTIDDIKSLLITNTLIFAPLFATSLLESLQVFDFGKYSVVVSLLIGSALKALQKYNKETYYPRK